MSALRKLRDFGYAFNAAGQLRKINKDTNEPGDDPFQFDVYGDQEKNQNRYEKLGELIPEIVYELLLENGMQRVYVPEGLPQEESTFIFKTPKPLQKSSKLLVLIHGSGFVRAGQWARSLIINNSLDHGTQIPYLKRAQELNYDVLIMNTNDNFRTINGKRKAIPQVGGPTEHANYVWKNFVIGSEPESVAIVAHSYGGPITMDLAANFPEFFKNKVFGIAFTDSAHFSVPKNASDVIKNVTRNWVASSLPLDTEHQSKASDIERVSAGHKQHEWTSWSAMDSVFKYLEDKYVGFISGKSD